ncbi:MAG: hypothetical protein KatS3mg042_1543 [Rhodothermaceae bacterium]|nr:MAG: hypothetical protein KatS3mg042_1543 [Rhodothermaceae bacterium]
MKHTSLYQADAAPRPDTGTPRPVIPRTEPLLPAHATPGSALSPYAMLLQTQARARAADKRERAVVADLAHRLYAALLAFLGCDKKQLVLGVMILPERQTYYDFMLLLRLDDGLEPRLTMRIQPGDPYELTFITEEGNVLSHSTFPTPEDTSEPARAQRAEAMTRCFSDLVEALRQRLETQVRTWTEKRAIY